MRWIVLMALLASCEGYEPPCPECNQTETPKPGMLEGVCSRTPSKVQRVYEHVTIIPLGKICLGSLDEIENGACYVSDPIDEKPFGSYNARGDVYCVAETPTKYLIERIGE